MRLAASLAAICAALTLAACASQAPPQQPHGHADLLLETERGMHGVAFDAEHTYLTLANSHDETSAVLRSGAIINRASVWHQLELGACSLGPAPAGAALRAPALARLAGGIYLFQRARGGSDEHALCKLERAYDWFQPRDDGLRACLGRGCERLWLTDLQHHDGWLLSNAGGGPNVLATSGAWRNWDAWLGSVASHACGHAAFRVAGRRLLVGQSSCGQAPSTLRAYVLGDGRAALAPAAPLRLPALEKRGVHLIAHAGRGVYAGLDGALLKSDDNGRSFRYVILHAPGAHQYPAIGHVLALRKRAQVVLAAGADAGTGQPYLAVSRDGGEHWTELSSILPGHAGATPLKPAGVTSLVQDRAGRVLLTLNLAPHSQGRLLMLTLGGVD